MNDPKAAVGSALQTGELVTIDLRAATPGLVLPPDLLLRKYVRLNLGYKKAPAPQVTSFGISAQLSFGGHWMLCFVPWEALLTVFVESLGAVYFQRDALREVVSAPAVEIVGGSVDKCSQEPDKWVRTRNGREVLRIYSGGGEGGGLPQGKLHAVTDEDDNGDSNGK